MLCNHTVCSKQTISTICALGKDQLNQLTPHCVLAIFSKQHNQIINYGHTQPKSKMAEDIEAY